MRRPSLIPKLPRLVWLFEAGVVVNAFGNGIIAPFVIIYLHNARHFSLGVSGAVFATFAGMSFLATFPGGTLADHIGPKPAIVLSLSIQALGLVGFAFASHIWLAFLFMALVGIGNGGYVPSQSSLLAAVVPSNARQAVFSVQRMADNGGMGLGGVAGGLIAVSSRPHTFSALFLIDAATIVVFVLLMLILVRQPLERAKRPATGPVGWRAVRRERLVLSVIGLNLLYVLGGYVVFEAVMPAVAKNGTALSEHYIGVIYMVNTLTVALAQLPLLKWFSGKRRSRLLAGMCLLWGLTWLGLALVVHLHPSLWLAFLSFALAALLFAIGEGGFSVQNALVADLAPEHIRGRVMALVPASFTFSFMLGSISAGFLLEVSFVWVFIAAAIVLAVAGLRALALERQLPEDKRRVPSPEEEGELEAETAGEAPEAVVTP